MEILLHAKADPDAADDAGSTPLVFASQEGFVEVAQLLLENNCDPNADTGTTNPLAIAVKRERLDMAEVLFEACCSGGQIFISRLFGLCLSLAFVDITLFTNVSILMSYVNF